MPQTSPVGDYADSLRVSPHSEKLIGLRLYLTADQHHVDHGMKIGWMYKNEMEK